MRTETIVLAVGGAAALVAVGVLLASRSSASTPSPTSAGKANRGAGVNSKLPPIQSPPTGSALSTGSCPAPAVSGASPPMLHIVTLAQNKSVYTLRMRDVLRTSLFISVTGFDWLVVSDNPSVLFSDTHTSGPDATDLSGTDAVDVWDTQGKTGTAVLTGKLLSKTVAGPAAATFSLTVNVTC